MSKKLAKLKNVAPSQGRELKRAAGGGQHHQRHVAPSQGRELKPRADAVEGELAGVAPSQGRELKLHEYTTANVAKASPLHRGVH